MESDPQVVVALAALAIKKTTIPVASTSPVQAVLRHHDTLPVLVSSSTAEGITAVPDQPTSLTNDSVVDQYEVDRTVLDAFASIVATTASQCMAVALEIDISKHVAVLTIAGNTLIGPDLIPYLNGIWRLMSVMSKRSEQRRREVNLTEPVGVQPPISIDAAIEPWRTELIRRVYLYCRGKDFQLLESRWNSLGNFVSQFKDEPCLDRILQGQVKDSIFALGATNSVLRNLVHRPDMKDNTWEDLISLMDVTVWVIEIVLDDRSRCEEWIKEQGCELLYVPYDPCR